MKNNFYTWLIFAASFIGYTATMYSQIIDEDCNERFSNVVFNQVNSTTADIQWEWETLSINSITIEYGEKGFELGTGIQEINRPDFVNRLDTFQINSLQALTEYDVYLSTDCHSLGPISFTTTENDCNTNFYDEGGPDEIYPSGRFNRTIYPSSEEERVRVIFDYIELTSDSGRRDVTDVLSVYNGEDASAELLVSYTGDVNDEEVVSTDVSGALHFVFNGGFSLLGNIRDAGTFNEDLYRSRGWEAQIICEEKPACLIAPTNFNIIEVDDHAISLDWDYEENSEFEEFVIEYGESGFELGTGTVITTLENNITINDLESVTNYNVYLRASCENDLFSEPRIIEFETEPDYCAGDVFIGSISNGQVTLFDSSLDTIYPDDIEGGRVRVVLNSLSISPNASLTVYDGDSRFANVLATYSTTPIEQDIEFVSTHSTGALTFIAVVNSNFAGLSWSGQVFCETVESGNTLPINSISELVTGYDTTNQHNGSFETIDNGNTLQLTGNAWAKSDFDYTITESTVVEFDVKITGEGEIHGIAFDNDDMLNGNEELFQIGGTQTYGIQDFNTYTGNDWVSYSIPVGEFFTGDFNNIVFVADKDADPTTQESFFRNVNFQETAFPINSISELVTGYDRVNQHNGSFKTIDNENTLQLNGNAWAKSDFDYTITESTVVEFDIKITGEGEIHGIAFDNDDMLNGNEELFQIGGTQTYGIQDYNTYTGTDWVSYSIPIGEFLTGDFNNIVFVADKDVDPTTQESFFRNISFFENTFPINSTPEGVTRFDTINQHNGTFKTIDNRNTLQLNDNAWVKTDFNYTVTENTVVEFDIKITGEGEIHGILLEDNNILDGDDSDRLFQISGSQIYGLQDYNTYEGNDWVSYAIPVGRFFTGDFNNIVFVADKDADPTTQESFFRNVNFSEQITFPINNTPEAVTEYGRFQHFGSFSTIDGGNTLQLDGNAWTKADLNYTVTENTIIEFDIKITGEGEVHGIRLDDDNTSFDDDVSVRLFQVSGSQIVGIQDYNNYTGNDWVSYSIPVGEFLTGDFSYIIFVADKDADPATQESFFRNVNIFENTAQNLASKQISSLSTINQMEASFVGPNPANEYIDIQSSFNQVISDVYIYSLDGRLIKRVASQNSDKLHINVSDIPDGMYLVNYIIGVESHTTKIVVKH